MKKFLKLSRHAREVVSEPKRMFLETGILDDSVGCKVAARILLKRYLYNQIINRKSWVTPVALNGTSRTLS